MELVVRPLTLSPRFFPLLTPKDAEFMSYAAQE